MTQQRYYIQQAALDRINVGDQVVFDGLDQTIFVNRVLFAQGEGAYGLKNLLHRQECVDTTPWSDGNNLLVKYIIKKPVHEEPMFVLMGVSCRIELDRYVLTGQLSLKIIANEIDLEQGIYPGSPMIHPSYPEKTTALAPNEIMLKNYSEYQEVTVKLERAGLVRFTQRWSLENRLPIYQVLIPLPVKE